MVNRERAVKRVDRQITKLEDKEDEQGFLSEYDKERLNNLKASSFNARRKIAEEKQVDSASGTKASKAAGSAVREALAESGGGPAAAKMLADRDNISIDEAYTVVSSAMEGSGPDIDRLKKYLPNFAGQYSQIGPEGKAAKEAAKAQAAKQKEWDRGVSAQDRMLTQEERQEEAETKHQADQRYSEERRKEREQAQAETRAAREADHAAELARQPRKSSPARTRPRS